ALPESEKAADGRFGDHDSAVIDPEIIAAVDQAGHSVHDEMVARCWSNVEDNVPSRARQVIGPVIVPDYNPSIFGVATRCDECTAVFGSVTDWDAFGLKMLRRIVVIGELHVGVHRDQIQKIELRPVCVEAIYDSG